MNRQRAEYALANLAGCWNKLDDAMNGRYGMTAARAVVDARDPLRQYTREVAEELGLPDPFLRLMETRS